MTATDSTAAAAGRDRIDGFPSGVADIGLSALGLLDFVGTGTFSGVGQVRHERRNDTTVIFVNIEGGNRAEMRIDIAGLHVLTEADVAL